MLSVGPRVELAMVAAVPTVLTVTAIAVATVPVKHTTGKTE
jgi:hypothetical protein